MEFKVYDAAFAKQHNTAAIIGMPLVSWDIYSQFLFQTNALINDVNSLNQIATKNQWKSVWDFKENLQDKTVIENCFCNQKHQKNERIYSKRNCWKVSKNVSR
jgi:hypothetical protein